MHPDDDLPWAMMERRIDLSNLDLDRAAKAVSDRRDEWSNAGLAVHPITWMDNDVPWPAPIVTERSQVLRPRSLRVHLERGQGAEAEVVLYAGGWADVGLLTPSMTLGQEEYHELDDVDEFGALLDNVVSRLLAPS
jgi:hypothetical protein